MATTQGTLRWGSKSPASGDKTSRAGVGRFDFDEPPSHSSAANAARDAATGSAAPASRAAVDDVGDDDDEWVRFGCEEAELRHSAAAPRARRGTEPEPDQSQSQAKSQGYVKLPGATTASAGDPYVKLSFSNAFRCYLLRLGQCCCCPVLLLMCCCCCCC
jgi:hypothetical protein